MFFGTVFFVFYYDNEQFRKQSSKKPITYIGVKRKGINILITV